MKVNGLVFPDLVTSLYTFLGNSPLAIVASIYIAAQFNTSIKLDFHLSGWGLQ